jgi:transcriptional regulator with GAF, ATPase, and Fis domain
MIMHKIRSVACVPLVLKGKFIGLIYIDSQNQKAQFNQQTMRFLEAFANQAAIAIENARLLESLLHENELLRGEVQKIFSFDEIIGKSQPLQSVLSIVDKVLKNDTTILLEGETGTGKELIARVIHYNGHRKKMPFIAVNCAAIPENLIESELFGYKKGAFTGAVKDKKGLMEEAEGGTLFLDEIAEIPMNLQVKLLRFLQEHEISPVGGLAPIKIDVRIIAASNKNLPEAIQAGTFREDLFYRLNVVSIKIPPLRERKEDILPMIEGFIEKYGKENNKETLEISKEAADVLMKYNYPGNVRELENIIERAVVLTRSKVIILNDLPMNIKGFKEEKTLATLGKGTLTEQVEAIEKQLIFDALQESGGNQTKAGKLLGLTERNLRYKLKKYNIKH